MGCVLLKELPSEVKCKHLQTMLNSLVHGKRITDSLPTYYHARILSSCQYITTNALLVEYTWMKLGSKNKKDLRRSKQYSVPANTFLVV